MLYHEDRAVQIMTGDEPGFVLRILGYGMLLFVLAAIFLGLYALWWVG